MEEAPALGIDLGTTYCCIGYWENGRVKTIRMLDGGNTLPSCVAFTKAGKRFGRAAKENVALTDSELVNDSKRMLGRTFDDLSSVRKGESKPDMARWPFTVERNPDNDKQPVIKVTEKGEEKKYSPEEISSMLLRKLTEAAKKHFGGKLVKDVVITVPAYFSNAQRLATEDAAKMANLNVLRLIKEPVAAAIAYKVESPSNRSELILSFDLGGGTFDLSLMAVTGDSLEVVTYGGDMHLGGQDFDYNLQLWFIQQLEASGIALPAKDSWKYKALERRLRVKAEEAKIALSEDDEFTLDFDTALEDAENVQISIPRSIFEEINKPLFDKCVEMLDALFIKADNYTKADVTKILMVGGSTRMTKICDLVKDYFGIDPKCDLPTDELVMHGAAIEAAKLGPLADPASKVPKFAVIDKTPKSVGVHVKGGHTVCVMPHSTAIPGTCHHMFTTSEDYQNCVAFKIYEGEDAMSCNNDLIGDFLLEGIQIARAGVPNLDVTMEIDASNKLHVTARDTATGVQGSREIDVGVIWNALLSPDDVKRRTQSANRSESEEGERRAAAMAREAARIKLKAEVAALERRADSNEVSWVDSWKLKSQVQATRDWLVQNPNVTVDVLTEKLGSIQMHT